jgi:demethylmenaquinone methyltransferase/2-methoxy-6-polyprenyl-1,4-benzoquinol methylase
MFDTIAPRYEMVNKVLTLGMDHRWRQRAVTDLRLPPGSRVLDIAAGTGDFFRELGRQGLQPVALDLSWGMLQSAHETSVAVQADASRLPIASRAFDGITCGYGLRNFTDLAGALREMSRVLRPGGRVALLEVAEPTRSLTRTGFRLWFRHVGPAIGGALSDREAYHYLPASTVYLPPADELREMMVEAGFSGVNHRLIMGGLSQQWIATRHR